MIFFIAAGAAIWFGWWRSWVDWPMQYYLHRTPGVPWFALAMAFGGIVIILRSIGIEVPQFLVEVVILSCIIIALVVAAFQWPRWALPPWYRKLQEEGQRPSKKSSHRRRRSAQHR
ncbi:MAG: hypothetical protein EPO21_04885 [Chloroflexota bacterium]|nr:MAG: hypothetical protein EPO21_04885 [Chloroflexota bacterium]